MYTEREEFVRSVWSQAFETHKRQRVDLKVWIEVDSDDIYYCAEEVATSKEHRSIAEFSDDDWRIYRVSYLSFVVAEPDDLPENLRTEKTNISLEGLGDPFQLIAQHTPNGVLKHIDVWEIPRLEPVLQKLDEAQLLSRSLHLSSTHPAYVEFLLRRCEGHVLQFLELSSSNTWDTSIVPVVERFCMEYRGRPRFFFARRPVFSTAEGKKAFLKRVIENWKAQPRNRVEISFRRAAVEEILCGPTTVVRMNKFKIREMLAKLTGVSPLDLKKSVLLDSTRPIDFTVLSFRLHHPEEQEVLEIKVCPEYVNVKSLPA